MIHSRTQGMIREAIRMFESYRDADNEAEVRLSVQADWLAIESPLLLLVSDIESQPDSIIIDVAATIDAVFDCISPLKYVPIAEPILAKARSLLPRFSAPYRELSQVYFYLLHSTGKLESARSIAYELLSDVTLLSQREPSEYVTSAVRVIEIHSELGDLHAVEDLCKDLLQFQETQVGKQATLYADALYLIAALYDNTGRSKQATKIMRQAERIYQQQVTGGRDKNFRAMRNLAAVHIFFNQHDKAERLYESMLNLESQFVQLPPVEKISLLKKFSHVCDCQGKTQKALQILQGCLTMSRQEQNDDEVVASLLNDIAVLYDSLKEHDKARDCYRAAVEIYERMLGGHHPVTIDCLSNLAFYFESVKDKKAAKSLHRKVLNAYIQIYGTNHLSVADTLMNLGFLAREDGKYLEAMRLFRRAEKIRRSVLDDSHSDVADTWFAMGDTELACGRHQAAKSLFERAKAIYQTVGGSRGSEYRSCQRRIRKCDGLKANDE